VPERFVNLARAISKAIIEEVPAPIHEHVWDCLMEVADGDPTSFQLWVVIDETVAPSEVEHAIADAMLRVPTIEGVLSELLLVTKENLPCSVIETAYAADLSQLTPDNLA
jgi:hypothetical protein